MKTKAWLIALLGILLVVLGGCVSSDKEGAADIVPTVPVPSELESLAKEISADLEKRTGVSAEAISLTKVESLSWADGSLGCPQPGMMYTMAIVEGYRLVYTVAGKEYSYHTAAAKRFIYCDESALLKATPVPSPISQEK